MTSNVVNQVAYLKTSRDFPEEIKEFSKEADKAYIDTANAVNVRTIGIFPINRSAINGETWFLQGNRKQQGLRQVYLFTSAGNIPHNINNILPEQFVRGFGSYTDGTNSYGVIYATNVAIAGQVTFYLTQTNIVVLSGGGAPSIVSGKIVIEWISQP